MDFFFPIWLWGSAWRSFGPPELRYKNSTTLAGQNFKKKIDTGAIDSSDNKNHMYTPIAKFEVNKTLIRQ